MVKACRKAAKIRIRDFGEIENLQVSLKGPGDFVTNCDKKVEKILIDELLKARPSYSILSEEIGEINNDDSFKANSLFLASRLGPPVKIIQSSSFDLDETRIL